MGGSASRSESRSKPVIEPAAISSSQREQLFPILGNLLGFSYGPTGAVGAGGSNRQTYPGFESQSWLRAAFDPRPTKFQDIQPTWGAGTFGAKDVTQYFNPISTDRNNSYADLFQAAMNNPYNPTSAESQLLSNIMGQTSAQFANRGLGASPVAASSVAGSIAPSLIAMRQQQLANLLQGFTTQEQVNQNISQNLLTQRSQDINSSIQQRQMQLEGLMKFLESMGLSRNMGQQSSGITASGSGGVGGGMGGGGSPGGGSA